ncbi:PqqD family protein [Candidatus Electronema sp. PJ]|uniref:PqqD family protein n=1 Tax=Candidatus Electronema sp. PJ TaxID=3401572 RepID=UPI003AA7F065
MDNTQRFTLNQDYKVEQFEDEILLYAVTTGKGVYLNETACLVWEMCGKGLAVGEMIALVTEAYPEQQAVIPKDISTAIQMLLANGIVYPAP